jgi:hypothetical protein
MNPTKKLHASVFSLSLSLFVFFPYIQPLPSRWSNVQHVDVLYKYSALITPYTPSGPHISATLSSTHTHTHSLSFSFSRVSLSSFLSLSLSLSLLVLVVMWRWFNLRVRLTFDNDEELTVDRVCVHGLSYMSMASFYVWGWNIFPHVVWRCRRRAAQIFFPYTCAYY